MSGGRLTKQDCPVPWALTVRWEVEEGRAITFVNCYAAIHTDGVDANDIQVFGDYLFDLQTSYVGDVFVIAGDLNVDLFRRPTATGKEGKVLEIVATLRNNGFTVVPLTPEVTYVDSGTTLDYVAVLGNTRPLSCAIEDVSVCQHLPVTVTTDISWNLQPLQLPRRPPNCTFSAVQIERVRDLLEKCIPELNGTVDDIYERIESAFLSCGSSRAKRVEVDDDQVASWWRYVPTMLRDRLKVLEARAKDLFALWRQDPSELNLSNLISSRRELNSCGQEARRAADVELQRKMSEDFADQALCWKVLRSLRSPSTSVAIDVGTLHSHFSRVFHRTDRPVIQREDMVDGWGTTAEDDRELDQPFTDAELVRALKELNGHAATGPEGISSSTLKLVFSDPVARSGLLVLMNACWADGKIPLPWGESELFVLYKGKGLRTLADNYRAIALSNDFRRVFERLVGSRLSRWIVKYDSTGRMQFGFKRRSGTLEAVFTLQTYMRHCTVVCNRPGFAMFVDMRKAFPSMSRPMIIETLRRKEAPAFVTRSLGALMSSTTSRLRVNNRLAENITVTSGTPEGSINSPDVFNVVYLAVLKKLGIKELPDDWSLIDPDAVYYIIFADDLTLFSMNLRALEREANRLTVECVPFDLEVNRGKTKWVAFLPSDPLTSERGEHGEWEIMVDGVQIENVSVFTYLGFELDSFLTGKAHVDKIKSNLFKASRAVGQLLRDMQCANLFSLKKYLTTLVLSQLYGLILVPCEALEVERAIDVFLKTVMSLPSSFPQVVASAIIGAREVRVFQLEQRLKFLLKLEGNPRSPAFSALVYDRVVLFRRGCGLNALLGRQLTVLDVLPTIDYRVHFQDIVHAMRRWVGTEHRERLLSASGRAFWVELAQSGFLPTELRSVLADLTYEQVRIVILFFADSLGWTSLQTNSKKCECGAKFISEHFFSCSRSFLSGREWACLLSIWQCQAWLDFIELLFDVLARWVRGTNLFKSTFCLSVLEFTPFAQPLHEFNPFRINV
jgi:hypothetical protein